ncbi:Helix-turn-helix domain-containing protein [Desulfomicrobium apsheronum]|jgi:transcriptional regulator with XRE-family HTH domain|uniref:Helix-turn-helix domain-containing protein n=2 Tax=Desulfomicrobium apsheronum TaxID=52560 RepID=A0A1I3YIU1_9BACT|nr:Helix-turn-helix domain-containing protein [Desulfomicrobium apsheronum]
MPTSPCSTCPFRPVMPDRAYFEQHGLGVSEVARRLGVSVSNVSRWFTSGHVPVGRREDLLRLAVELACRNEPKLPAKKEVRNEFSDL